MKKYSVHRRRRAITALTIILAAASICSLMSGTVDTTLEETLRTIAGIIGFQNSTRSESQLSIIMGQIRIPRLLLGILVGSGLAVSGAIMQALFRNPMADPGLLGISSGAALGAVAAIVLGSKLMPSFFFQYGAAVLPLFAFFAGMVTLLIVLKLSKTRYKIDAAVMLLAGVAINAIAGALIGLLSYIADDAQLRDLIFWSLGSVEITDWRKLTLAMIIIFPIIGLMLRYANALNANLLGENEAKHLGVEIDKVKITLVVLVSGVVGISVALSGIIGFIGLLVPHLLRLVIGADHRILLPASALSGAILLVLADIVARTLVAPAEIPIGIITAILGGPFFLWLLVRHRKNQPA